MAAIGISNGTEVGWVCRYDRLGYYSDYGGYGYTKQQAIDLMRRWCKDEDARPRDKVQLFPIYEKEPSKPHGCIIVSGRFLESERKPAYGGWDLH